MLGKSHLPTVLPFLYQAEPQDVDEGRRAVGHKGAEQGRGDGLAGRTDTEVRNDRGSHRD